MDDRADLDAVVAALTPHDGDPADVAATLPRRPGLVAWWAVSGVPLLTSGGSDRTPTTEQPVPLAVGAATSLRNRVGRQDLWRTGVSWPRRCLAGLLLADLGLAPVWAAEVVLPRADEDRLTAWMRGALRLGWVADERRRELLEPVTAAVGPVLREGHEPATGAEAHFVAAAGERPYREPGVPYRRP